MDINDLRSLITVLGLVVFLAIVKWAYGQGAKKGFEEAARIPLDEDESPKVTPGSPGVARQ